MVANYKGKELSSCSYKEEDIMKDSFDRMQKQYLDKVSENDEIRKINEDLRKEKSDLERTIIVLAMKLH